MLFGCLLNPLSIKISTEVSSFIHSMIRSFVRSFVHLFIHLLIHSSIVFLFVHFTALPTYKCVYQITFVKNVHTRYKSSLYFTLWHIYSTEIKHAQLSFIFIRKVFVFHYLIVLWKFLVIDFLINYKCVHLRPQIILLSRIF